MSGDAGGGGDDHREVFGPIDAGALRSIRDVFTKMEPLVATAALDDSFDPGVLEVDLTDGIGAASAARVDVRWSLTGNYSFHYSDEAGVDFRFDRHPKPGAPREHFHPPPAAPSDAVEPSCISVTGVALVARAVVKLWRDAYDRGSIDGVNEVQNPP